MTINELKNLGEKAWDGRFKSLVASHLQMGRLSEREIIDELGTSRTLLRQWLRWDYAQRVERHNQGMKKSRQEQLAALQKRVLELERQLSEQALRVEGLEVLLDIGRDEHGVDLRKRRGAKRSEG